jgi:isopenicillin N synthase-like dioxygenase
VRAAAHEDINLITLLPAGSSRGLEVKDKQGNWHAVPLCPGSMIVNIGDM